MYSLFSVHDPKEGHASHSEVAEFHRVLNNFLRGSLQVHLKGLVFKKVELPVVSADARGKVRRKALEDK